jgi:hypothetical protein
MMLSSDGLETGTAVRIQFAPPTSLVFKTLSAKVREPRAYRGDGREPSAPENAKNGEPQRVTPIFSLSASNSVPMPAVGNVTSSQKYHRLLDVQSGLL